MATSGELVEEAEEKEVVVVYFTVAEVEEVAADSLEVEDPEVAEVVEEAELPDMAVPEEAAAAVVTRATLQRVLLVAVVVEAPRPMEARDRGAARTETKEAAARARARAETEAAMVVVVVVVLAVLLQLGKQTT